MNKTKFNTLEAKMAWRDFDETSNKAIDWLIASWDKKGDEKKICLHNYKRYKEKSKEAFYKWREIVYTF